MSSRRVKGLEFAVDDSSGRQRIFDTFGEAAAFAITIAASNGREVNLDVLAWDRKAAKAWGGDDGVEEYDADPDASVSDRIVIRAESQGRVA